MGIQSYLKNTAKANTNVKAWSGWDSIKANGKIVGAMAKDLKTPNREASASIGTFEETMQKFGLTEADLRQRMRSHLYLAIICAVLGLGAFGWMIHLLIKGMFLSGMVSLALSFMMFAYAFSEHFNYFKIKNKKLDCTLKEWYSEFFPNKKY